MIDRTNLGGLERIIFWENQFELKLAVLVRAFRLELNTYPNKIGLVYQVQSVPRP